MIQEKSLRPSALGPVALASIQIDVTTRLGVPPLSTTTGLPTLDRVLGGGLRPGTLLGLVSPPGFGRTTLALLMAYMAARSRAAALFTGVGLDDAEVVSRLAARALHRERPDAQVPYGAIWSGQSLQEPELVPQVLNAVDIVMRKVGSQLHVYPAETLEPTGTLAERASQLWSRSERVLLVVDDIAKRSLQLGREVTVARIDGALHDVFLSRRPVRAAAYAAVTKWLEGYAPRRGG